MAMFAPGRSPRDSLDPRDALISRVGQVYDPEIMAFRPQRYSLASSKSSLSWNSFESPPSSLRSSAASLATLASSPSFNSLETPSVLPHSSRHSTFISQQKVRSTGPPTPVFHRLPSEVYDCVLQQIENFHNEPASMSCHTCYLRDMCALALTNRRWDRAVRSRLYTRIFIVGHDSPVQLKKHKTKAGVRLKLLRRTLRERRVLAQYVRELKVPRLQEGESRTNGQMRDLVASVVMSCPNLEKLLGFYPVYGHEFDRLTHALSTRPRFKEHVWSIGENQSITERSQKQLPPGLMDNDQVDRFLHLHDSWTSLSTLFLFSHRHGILERDIIVQVLHRLPSLQHLCISNFDIDDFDDVTLQLLPPLQSLRLQELEGVTFWGLSEFSRTKSAQSLRRISLVRLDITYISAISNLLLHLINLTRFTIVQDSAPEAAAGELIFQPIIASQSLEYLHWDIIVPGSANINLTSSITAGGFPNLRTIRAPSDHDGLLQMLCRPKAQIILPSDKYNRTYNSSSSSSSSKSGEAHHARLLDSRKAAQQRIENAQNTVSFKVIVEEEDGTVREVYDLSGFIGTVGSKISYSLAPDVLGSDDALVDFPDLFGGSKEMAPRKDCCTGMWNASHHAGKKWWNHVERHRFRPIDLQSFF